MIRVTTGSRVHFGLLRLDASRSGHDGEGPSLRRYSGVGLMVEKPHTVLSARPARGWSAQGPLANRVLEFAERLTGALASPSIEPLQFTVEEGAPEHCGFGAGTQLAMAVAQGICKTNMISGYSTAMLARLMGRGTRTGIGVAGFERGGLLFDVGAASATADDFEVLRRDFPEAWRIVIFLPPTGRGLHGEPETAAFDLLEQWPESRPDARAALEEVWRAAETGNFQTFCVALQEFNSEVGSIFASLQGGVYAHPMTGEMIRFLRARGFHGVGQSSWGPAGFAIVEDEESGEKVVSCLRQRFKLDEAAVTLTRAANQGAKISVC